MKRARIGFEVQEFLHKLVHESPQTINNNNDLINKAKELDEEQTSLVLRASRDIESGESVDITVYLLDTEGTTVPLSFMTHALRLQEARVEEFVQQRYPTDLSLVEIVKAAANHCQELQEALAASDSDTKSVCTLFVKHIQSIITENNNNNNNNNNNRNYSYSSGPQYYNELMDLMLEEAFTSGTLRGHLFEDAVEAICAWGSYYKNNNTSNNNNNNNNNTNISKKNYNFNMFNTRSMVMILGSRGPAAEAALFRHSTHGDLTSFIATFLDSQIVGSRSDPSCYLKARREALRLTPPAAAVEVIFITDVSNAAVAARASGAVDLTFLALRPHNRPHTLDTLSAIDVTTLSAFQQLQGEPAEYARLCDQVRKYNSDKVVENGNS